MADRDPQPVLWHLELSHYNEKVRWALDHKRIPHRRRPLPPGAHVLVARRLTGGACETTPVLSVDGTSLGESAAIIAALEHRWPEAPLYPVDAAERSRALELEAFCDTEIGPHIRRAAYEHLLARPDLLIPAFVHDQPPVPRALMRVVFPGLRALMRRHFEVNATAAAESRERIRAAVDRLERELAAGAGPVEDSYLVGDRFSVADLAAASLLYPIARPASFPYPIPEVPPEGAGFIDELAQRPIGRWVQRIYMYHREAPGTRRTLRLGLARAAAP